MTSILERVARAMCRHDISWRGTRPEMDENHAWDWFSRTYFNQARAALEGLREPTEEMIAAAYEDNYEGDSFSASASWTKMIDAALTEKP